jgi:predicted cation transporter
VDNFVNIGLLIIFILVLVLPFRIKIIERNLEFFLFLCGTAALTLSGFAAIPGETTGWNARIVLEALTTPLNIATIAGIPVGIVQIVLIAGIAIYLFHHQLQDAFTRLIETVPLTIIVPSVIIILGLVSSIISAILAAIILVEIVNALPVGKQSKIELAVVACFSIGLGAGLTPLGEPLSTIVVSKLSGEPYHAGFGFLLQNLGLYIVPSVFGLGVVGLILFRRSHAGDTLLECIIEREKLADVVIRAGKIYLFIMALIFLGEGFRPLIMGYISLIPGAGLFWINIISAVLDNATLAAAEISPVLSLQQIVGSLMGLMIAGGMLIPGNIPNIIAAGRLEITSAEWARTGIPLGLTLMVLFFGILFVPAILGFA